MALYTKGEVKWLLDPLDLGIFTLTKSKKDRLKRLIAHEVRVLADLTAKN